MRTFAVRIVKFARTCLAIALDESDETSMWLAVIEESALSERDELKWLIGESGELRAIHFASVSTARLNLQGPQLVILTTTAVISSFAWVSPRKSCTAPKTAFTISRAPRCRVSLTTLNSRSTPNSDPV